MFGSFDCSKPTEYTTGRQAAAVNGFTGLLLPLLPVHCLSFTSTHTRCVLHSQATFRQEICFVFYTHFSLLLNVKEQQEQL